jgi:DNA primase
VTTITIDETEIEDIRNRCDLLVLAGRNTSLKKVSTGNGGEYAGPCPWCGGDDRFRVQPTQQRWWCRNCSADEHWQDCFAYVMKWDGLTFPEAVRALGGGSLFPLRSEPLPPPPPPAPEVPREMAWQEDAEALVSHAQVELSRNAELLGWLQRERGITPETAWKWRVGHLEQNSSDLGSWGALDQKPSIWLPAGLVIPVYGRDELLWTVKVKLGKNARWPCSRCDKFIQGAQCPDCGRERMKYWKASGTPANLLGLAHVEKRSAAVLCEGELDAILLSQQAGDLVDVFSGVTGVSSWQSEWNLHLLAYQKVLVAYDADEEGQKWAGTRIKDMPGRLRRMKPPQGKDVTEFWKSGGNLFDWVQLRLGAQF